MGIKYNGKMTLIGTSKVSRPKSLAPPNFTDAIEQKITGNDIVANDRFGFSVAIDANMCIIGAATKLTGSGAAYVFTQTDGVWTQQQKLIASDAGTGDNFGYSVAIDANTCVVGAPFDDTSASNDGAVFIFTQTDGVWTEQQKLIASARTRDDQFGRNVALHNDTLVTSALYDDDNASNAGAAYIFTRTDGVWTEQQKIQASDIQASSFFSIAVDLQNDSCIIGAMGADSLYGAAYIFTRTDGVWTEQQKLTASDRQANDNLGRSVSINGDTCVVGSSVEDEGGDSAGAIYIFTRSEGVWTEQQKLIASDAETKDMFGYSASIEGDICVVGAYGEDTSGDNAGAIYIFTRSEGVWTEQQKLIASDAETSDNFGNMVDINNKTIISGVLSKDTNGTDAGAAYIYTAK